MARPIWTGSISFGLLNIPVALMPGERRTDLSFRMLDARDKAPIRFERVNAETGEEVPWKDIVKAFEYDKGSYVVIDKDDIASAAPETHESVDIEAFVAADSISARFFEKPYVLVPGKKADKGYVLLRETLKSTGRIGIGRVVVRTREYLCAVMPEGDALILNLLRYPQELVDPGDYALPAGGASKYKISAREVDMAKKLIESMATDWAPGDYHDEFRKRLSDLIGKRLRAKGAKTRIVDEPPQREDAATNVVDFMSLLQKSLDSNRRTPAKQAAGKTAKKAAKATKAAKKASAKTAAKKAAKPARKRA